MQRQKSEESRPLETTCSTWLPQARGAGRISNEKGMKLDDRHTCKEVLRQNHPPNHLLSVGAELQRGPGVPHGAIGAARVGEAGGARREGGILRPAGNVRRRSQTARVCGGGEEHWSGGAEGWRRTLSGWPGRRN